MEYFIESGSLRVEPKSGGKCPLTLNITKSPIANKYREGKLQSTLKREFKVPETYAVEGVTANV